MTAALWPLLSARLQSENSLEAGYCSGRKRPGTWRFPIRAAVAALSLVSPRTKPAA